MHNNNSDGNGDSEKMGMCILKTTTYYYRWSNKSERVHRNKPQLSKV